MMKYHPLRTLLSSFLLALCATGGTAQAASWKAFSADGGQAPAPLVLPDLAGRDVDLSSFKGEVVLVNFWATWCGPCVQEMPELSHLAGEDKGKHFNVIGIGIDSPTNMSEFAAKHQIAYPLYVAGMGGTELSKELGNTMGGLPYTVLIGADGQVLKTYIGKLKFDELRADLAKLKG